MSGGSKSPAGVRGAPFWLMQRLSALVLAPLALWLVLSLAALDTMDHGVVTVWIASPATAVLLSALVVTVCFHMALGLQVIIEDYVHVERGETIGILAVRIGSALLAVVAVGAVLKIATGVN